MKVKILSITIYDDNGQHWHSEETQNPTWPQIEQGIRAMHRYKRPTVSLHLRDDSFEIDYLSVTGGEGIYAIEGTQDDGFLNYFDSSKSEREISVWTSDQGYYPEEKYVCYDLELVLQIAQHYAERGEFFPGVMWRS